MVLLLEHFRLDLLLISEAPVNLPYLHLLLLCPVEAAVFSHHLSILELIGLTVGSGRRLSKRRRIWSGNPFIACHQLTIDRLLTLHLSEAAVDWIDACALIDDLLMLRYT